jgi:hypothetical protein
LRRLRIPAAPVIAREFASRRTTAQAVHDLSVTVTKSPPANVRAPKATRGSSPADAASNGTTTVVSACAALGTLAVKSAWFPGEKSGLRPHLHTARRVSDRANATAGAVRVDA